jgi:DNA-binding NtrC family response regulator
MPYSAIDTSISKDAPGRPRLLIVNPDPLTRELYTHVLNLDGYDVESAGDGADALEWLAVEECDVVVTDRFMPKLDGASMVLALRSAGSNISVVMISNSFAQIPLPERVADEISAAVPMPARSDEIRAAVAYALRGTARREHSVNSSRMQKCEA